jgi:transcription antitermination factor NusG
MSNVKKTVKISESDLVNLIDNIVSEAVQIKKKEWLAEQAAKGDKNAILESKLAKLEAKINKLTEGK